MSKPSVDFVETINKQRVWIVKKDGSTVFYEQDEIQELYEILKTHADLDWKSPF